MFVFVLRQRPPRSTRTDTLFPYTTVVRSLAALDDVLELVAAAQRHALAAQFVGGVVALAATAAAPAAVTIAVFGRLFAMILIVMMMGRLDAFQTAIARIGMIVLVIVGAQRGLFRSEERRLGKECVSTCRSRWSPSH